MKKIAILFLSCVCGWSTMAQSGKDSFYLLKPDRIFDGEQMKEGWQVLVRNNIIEEVGNISANKIPAGINIIELKGCTLLPGLIEGHSHLFLHAYNETSWNDQVLRESRAERIARAINHARNTLMAGFTTVRDLGTEGMGYDDVGLKATIEKGIIPGPRMLVATRAIVATGSYGPKELDTEIDLPQGAAEADGKEGLIKEVRTQAGHGADFIKVYADYRWGLDETTTPTFTEEELKAAAEAANSSGRQLVAHATTPEGMRRAVVAGAATIEHGDQGTPEIFKLMKDKKVALCATLAASEATSQYKGWQRGLGPEPQKITDKMKSFKAALKAGVTICFGGDAGVFPHGDNVREMEFMVFYGMNPMGVLQSATSVNADVFGLGNKLGRVKQGLLADLIAVEGNPKNNISIMRKIKLVMKNGVIYRQ
jgi:imidazolonepropionase-like amidohydrolase